MSSRVLPLSVEAAGVTPLQNRGIRVPSLSMPRSFSFLLLGSLLSTACFSERLPPPTFRHDCSGDEDCGDAEACINGLCQVECTLATSEMDCGALGQGSTYLGCINGVCASACDLDDDPCPGAQSCESIPGLSEALGAGVCMEMCTPDSCPDSEVCVLGFCAPSCDPNDPEGCGEGNTCLGGVCVPDEVGETMQPTSGNDSDTDTGDSE